MPLRPLSLLIAIAQALSHTACAEPAPEAAQAPAASSPPPKFERARVPAPKPDPLLPRVREALEAAEQGRYDGADFADVAGHPLHGWIEYAALRRQIDTLPRPRAEDFLRRHRDTAVGRMFRAVWLSAAARREDWQAFIDAWRDDIDDAALRCHALHARQALGRADADWTREVQTLWLGSGRSLPDACDPVFAVLDAQGGLSDAMRWQRIDKAVEAGQPAVIRAAARGLPAAERALAHDYAAFLEGVHARALDWPKTARSRTVAAAGLALLARRDPAQAEALLPRYAQALGFEESERGRVLYPAALWTVASYLPESARRLAAVPDSAYDQRLHEWRVREALARSDWRAALDAIRRMPAGQRADSRWTYFEARLAERLGERETAMRLYREAARKPDFHGFLAADRLELPYALCPLVPDDSAEAKAAVARDPAIVRAMALYRLGRAGWAVAEWKEALSRFDDAQRVIAVEVAQSYDWYDRAVFDLGRRPEEIRLYHLRFPLHHERTLRREAKANRLDPAFVAAEIRAESVFNPRARSGADARGLMQVLPGTGAQMARKLGLAWGGAETLYDPDTNIVLGTAYLRHMLDAYGGQPYFAIAGYNAGPAPLNRWRNDRPGMDPDFWIETITYKETRDYVARVLAFSVIYDWQLNGDAMRVSSRMRGDFDGPRTRFACPAAAAD